MTFYIGVDGGSGHAHAAADAHAREFATVDEAAHGANRNVAELVRGLGKGPEERTIHEKLR